MAKTQNAIDFAATTNSQLAINLTSAGPNNLDVNGTLAVGTYAGVTLATPANSAIISGSAGIGTSSPSTNLHVAGSSTTAAGELGTFLISSPATSGGIPRLIFGINSSGAAMNYGYIQAVENGGDKHPLVLQSTGSSVLIGSTSIALSEKLAVAPDITNRVCVYLTGTTRHATSAYGLYIDTALDTSGAGITTISALVFPNITNAGAGTVAEHYGLLVAAGTMAVTPTNSYGIYANNPTAGGTKTAIYSDNLCIGYTSMSPPTNGALILGNVAVGRSSLQAGRMQVASASSKTAGDGAAVMLISSSDASPVSLNFGLIGNVTAASQGIYIQATEAGVSDDRVITLQRFGGNVGVTTVTPGSKLSVNGNLSIGANYSASAAPTSGAIIEGNVGVGTSTVDSTANVQLVNTAKPYGLFLSGTQTAKDGGNDLSALIIPVTCVLNPSGGADIASAIASSVTFAPPNSQTISQAANFYINSQFSGSVTGSITNAYGLYISQGSSIGTLSAITNNYGLYVQNPNAGTTKLAIASEGDIATVTAGFGFKVKEGSNAKMGTATLVAGSSTVSTTAVTANSRIFLTVQQLGTIAVPTSIAVTARSAGTSFTITSLQATDTSVVAWIIFEPA